MDIGQLLCYISHEPSIYSFSHSFILVNRLRTTHYTDKNKTLHMTDISQTVEHSQQQLCLSKHENIYSTGAYREAQVRQPCLTV